LRVKKRQLRVFVSGSGNFARNPPRFILSQQLRR
jgi:hypothetical protein